MLAPMLLTASIAAEVDSVLMLKNTSGNTLSHNYNSELLKLALDTTIEQFGAYKLDGTLLPMTRDRQFAELKKGKFINVLASPYKEKYNKFGIRVPVPLKMGLPSSRIFLVTEENKDILKNITTIEQLKKVRTGAHRQWTTTKVLYDQGFNVIFENQYESLFKMLSLGHFDTFNRGIHEVRSELAEFKPSYPNLTYDKHLVLFFYLPDYYYVSEKTPKLAKRIEAGLRELHSRGELLKLMQRFFASELDEFELNKRRVFKIKNTNLAPGLYEHDKVFLLNSELL
ncbi:hypothetical protein [Catenovulum agarivorans]|uniref:hypothetical protein n=1 Tax=Catenovulum agarivorans TaxID=1172192 RepID=UPI0002F6E17B|nr:hypothetical protein [Catenovulum agarivorans]